MIVRRDAVIKTMSEEFDWECWIKVWGNFELFNLTIIIDDAVYVFTLVHAMKISSVIIGWREVLEPHTLLYFLPGHPSYLVFFEALIHYFITCTFQNI